MYRRVGCIGVILSVVAFGVGANLGDSGAYLINGGIFGMVVFALLCVFANYGDEDDE